MQRELEAGELPPARAAAGGDEGAGGCEEGDSGFSSTCPIALLGQEQGAEAVSVSPGRATGLQDR